MKNTAAVWKTRVNHLCQWETWLCRWSQVEHIACTHAWLQIGPPSPDYSFLDFLKCTCVFCPIKTKTQCPHTPTPPHSSLTTELVALKACGLCDNGRIVRATIRGQTGLGHLHRLRARLLLSSISWRIPPFRCSGTTAHYFWLSEWPVAAVSFSHHRANCTKWQQILRELMR